MNQDGAISALAVIGIIFLCIIGVPIIFGFIGMIFDILFSLIGALFSLLFGLLEILIALLSVFFQVILTLVETICQVTWFFIRRPTSYLARMVFGSEVLSRLYDRSRETIFRIRQKPKRTLATLGGCLLLIGFVVVAAVVKLLTKPE